MFFLFCKSLKKIDGKETWIWSQKLMINFSNWNHVSKFFSFFILYLKGNVQSFFFFILYFRIFWLIDLIKIEFKINWNHLEKENWIFVFIYFILFCLKSFFNYFLLSFFFKIYIDGSRRFGLPKGISTRWFSINCIDFGPYAASKQLQTTQEGSKRSNQGIEPWTSWIHRFGRRCKANRNLVALAIVVWR